VFCFWVFGVDRKFNESVFGQSVLCHGTGNFLQRETEMATGNLLQVERMAKPWVVIEMRGQEHRFASKGEAIAEAQRLFCAGRGVTSLKFDTGGTISPDGRAL
jgi:hypothetical protein